MVDSDNDSGGGGRHQERGGMAAAAAGKGGTKKEGSPAGKAGLGQRHQQAKQRRQRALFAAGAGPVPPIANMSRIMKKALPANAKISKDAKETVQECVSEFIFFITGEASDKCQREKRKIINGDDLLWAMTTLGFKDYVEPLKHYLHKFARSRARGPAPRPPPPRSSRVTRRARWPGCARETEI
ncbi:unnamed protein product [Urochloa humidicola]